MNKVQLTGRITKDIDIRMTPTNKRVCNVDIAVRKNVKNSNGEYESNFIRVQLWEQRADYLANYAHKGTMIGVSGSIETNNYVNKDGQRVYETFVLADSVEILAQPQNQTSNQVIEEDTSIMGGSKSNIVEDLGITQEELPFY